MDDTKFMTASDVAYRIISQKILDGEYPPGMKLSRRKMAEATGVSVIPVIEALKKLEEDMLVESKPQWGSFVTVPTIDKIKQCYQLREAIECQSARILAEKGLSTQQQAVLMSLATELDTVPFQEETSLGSRNSHVEFHTKLTEYTGNKLLVDALRRINMFWVLCKAISTNAPQIAYPRYWHRYLMDEIAKGDQDHAEAVMRIHVNDSLPALLSSVEKNG